MSVDSIVVHVRDLSRALDFYTTHLEGEVTDRDGDHAVLDFVTASVELRVLQDGRPAHGTTMTPCAAFGTSASK